MWLRMCIEWTSNVFLFSPSLPLYHHVFPQSVIVYVCVLVFWCICICFALPVVVCLRLFVCPCVLRGILRCLLHEKLHEYDVCAPDSMHVASVLIMREGGIYHLAHLVLASSQLLVTI